MIRYRYRRIVYFFARMLLSFIYWDILLPRLGMGNWSRKTRPERLRRSAIAYRKLAIQMGGVLIKVGQFLSTRVDVLPKEFTGELAGLQDEVPAEDFKDIKQVAEMDFGLPLSAKYCVFEETPLAAASLGQVHRARVRVEVSPEESPVHAQYDVVVKVQRPNIEQVIATDMSALRTVGDWIKRYPPVSRRADIPALLDEFSRILYEEIDYLAEGRNAETFAANFQQDRRVRVPEVIWTHTTKRVLTLENVWSIKITDYETITAAGICRADVASRLLDTYLKQIFEDGFFHADPHPGNLFVLPLSVPPLEVSPEVGRPWRLTFIDFGMVGRVPPRAKEALREMLIGVGTQNAARVVQSYQMLGVLLPGADLERLEQAEEMMFDQFWGRNMSELQQISPEEIHEFTSEFRELIYEMPFQIPQDIIFLGRAVGILSGMCTGLNPEFNVWEHIAPYAQKMLLEESIEGRDKWIEEAKAIAKSIVSLPIKLESVIGKIDRGKIAVHTPDMDVQVTRLESALKQLFGGIIFTALLLGGVQLYITNHITVAYMLFFAAGITLLWAILRGRKRAGRNRNRY